VLTIERYGRWPTPPAGGSEVGYDNIEVMFGDGFDIPARAGNFDRIYRDGCDGENSRTACCGRFGHPAASWDCATGGASRHCRCGLERRS